VILNGARHGVAGFGLGKYPNLNALLYDPTKALNTRFSVMANTTVARLYHSEASKQVSISISSVLLTLFKLSSSMAVS